MFQALLNPYRGTDFWEFVLVFCKRIGLLLSGQVGFDALASDEIQLFVLFGLSLSAVLVGSFLVLKQMTMLANALCHTILLGIVIAYLLMKPMLFDSPVVESGSFISLKILLMASFFTGILTTVLTQFFIHVMKLSEDASIGIVFTTLFALGVVLVTVFTKNVHLGTEAIMGNIDALDVDDLKLVGTLALCNAIVFLLFFKPFAITTFDPAFSRSIGISPQFYSYVLMVLTAATSVAAFRAVGVLLVLSFFVGPVLMARLLTDRLLTLLMISLGLAIFCSFVAVALSRHILSVYQIAISTSGLVVSVLSISYFFLLIFAPRTGLLAKRKKTVLAK